MKHIIAIAFLVAGSAHACQFYNCGQPQEQNPWQQMQQQQQERQQQEQIRQMQEQIRQQQELNQRNYHQSQQPWNIRQECHRNVFGVIECR